MGSGQHTSNHLIALLLQSWRQLRQQDHPAQGCAAGERESRSREEEREQSTLFGTGTDSNRCMCMIHAGNDSRGSRVGGQSGSAPVTSISHLGRGREGQGRYSHTGSTQCLLQSAQGTIKHIHCAHETQNSGTGEGMVSFAGLVTLNWQHTRVTRPQKRMQQGELIPGAAQPGILPLSGLWRPSRGIAAE